MEHLTGKTNMAIKKSKKNRGVRAMLSPDARGGMDDEMAELMKKTGCGKATEAEKLRMGELRASLQDRFMTLPLDEMFQVTKMDHGAPRPPKILQSLTCEHCGEKTMESRTRRFAGATLCIPCFQMVEQKI